MFKISRIKTNMFGIEPHFLLENGHIVNAMDQISPHIQYEIEADGTHHPDKGPGGRLPETYRLIRFAENPKVEENHQRDENQKS
jgi:hypothetical protein